MDQENGYRVRRLITVYCGYNSRLTVYCLHVADVIFERNRVQSIRGNSFPIPLLNYDAFLPFFFSLENCSRSSMGRRFAKGIIEASNDSS